MQAAKSASFSQPPVTLSNPEETLEASTLNNDQTNLNSLTVARMKKTNCFQPVTTTCSKILQQLRKTIFCSCCSRSNVHALALNTHHASPSTADLSSIGAPAPSTAASKRSSEPSGSLSPSDSERSNGDNPPLPPSTSDPNSSTQSNTAVVKEGYWEDLNEGYDVFVSNIQKRADAITVNTGESSNIDSRKDLII